MSFIILSHILFCFEIIGVSHIGKQSLDKFASSNFSLINLWIGIEQNTFTLRF